jgi:hypothetical protein
MHKLIDTLRVRKTAQANCSKIKQRDAGREPPTNQRGYRLGKERLPAMGAAHDACGTVDGVAEKIVVATLVHAGVQPATYAKSNSTGRIQGSDCL